MGRQARASRPSSPSRTDSSAASVLACVSPDTAVKGADSPRPTVPSASVSRTRTLCARSGAPVAMAKGSVRGRSNGSTLSSAMASGFMVCSTCERDSMPRTAPRAHGESGSFRCCGAGSTTSSRAPSPATSPGASRASPACARSSPSTRPSTCASATSHGEHEQSPAPVGRECPVGFGPGSARIQVRCLRGSRGVLMPQTPRPHAPGVAGGRL
jgi:hypothetical protein